MTPPRVTDIPNGAVRSLFDELRLLHRWVGEPSTRTLARRLGAGVLSHSAVHAVLRGPRVPRWGPLELVVRQLGGDVERFRGLWLKARDADRDAENVPAVPETPQTETPQTAAPVPLVGRRVELDSVRGWVADVVAGHGRIVVVEGEPGVGKSSLLRAAAQQAEAAGCRVYWATCDELSQAFPLLPLLDALDPRPSADHNGQPWAPAVSPGAPASGSSASSAAAPATLCADETPGTRIDLVAATTERLVALVDEVCAATPTLLAVDNIQWADPATVVAVGRLARLARRVPLLVVATTRPLPQRDDLTALRRAVAPADVLRLPGLDDAAVAEVVTRAVSGVPGPRLLELAGGAGGNPLYLTELVDALLRTGALTVEDGTVDAADARPPGSLSAAIADRLQFLSAATREVLRSAALLGVDFAVDDLAVVSRRHVNDLLPVLDEAVAAGVLLGDGPQVSFRHPLIRAALYAGIPPALRAARHRDTARALAAGGAPADRVARQLLPAVAGAGPAERWVVDWLAEAGRRLVGQAPQAAIPLLRWVAAGVPAVVAPHDLMVCLLAQALYRVGDTADAAEVATAALARVTRPDLLVDLHSTLALAWTLDGRAEEALVALRRALDLGEIGPAGRARLLVLTARIYRNLGRVETAVSVAEQALVAATAADERWAVGWALATLAVARGTAGQCADALPLLDRALAVADSDPALTDLRLMLRTNQARALGDLDRNDDALATAEQARQLADDAGNAVRLAFAQMVLTEVLFDLGRWDDALAEATSATESYATESYATESYSSPFVECCLHSMAAVIQLHRGDLAASQHLAHAEHAARRTAGSIGTFALARSLRLEQASAPAQALAVLMDEVSTEALEEGLELFADAVRLAITIGDRPAADTVTRHAEAVVGESAVPHRRATALHCRGLLDGDPAALLAAAQQYRVAGRPLPEAQALEAAATALAGSGETSRAGACLADAVSLYTHLGAEWDLGRIHA